MAKANFCCVDRLSLEPSEDFKSFCFGHKTFPNRGHEHTNEDRALLLPLDTLLPGVMVRRTPTSWTPPCHACAVWSPGLRNL